MTTVWQGPESLTISGRNAFGFNFDRRGNLIVTEAQGGAPDGSTGQPCDIQGDGLV